MTCEHAYHIMPVFIQSPKDGTTLGYSLSLIIGDVRPPQQNATIDVSTGDESLSWPIINGHFRVLVNLKWGKNEITFRYFGDSSTLVLFHKVPTDADLFVRPVYIKCSDDDGEFQGPRAQDCSILSAQQRIAFGSQLLQTFTAQKLNEHGFGHQTFFLEKDIHPSQPKCHVFTSKLTLREAHSMCSNELWLHFARELMTSKKFKLKEKCKWFAFLSFTRYHVENGRIPRTHSEVIRSTRGHTALGGGGLALYGTGTLHCWAESLDQVSGCFTDPQKIDRSKLMDDSAYREFYWANYSTGLGASLHELGHTFDLAHTPTGIMARGFDDLYRVFVVKPPTTRGGTPADSSLSASPIPYSPKQSPIHRPKLMNGSPKHHLQVHEPKPLCVHGVRDLDVIQIETAFKQLRGPLKHTVVMNHYDGSKVKKSTTRYPDGTELVTEVTSHLSGEQVIREHLQHTPSGKSRSTMSVSMWSCDHINTHVPNSTQCSNSGYHRPSAEKEPHRTNGFINFQELRCKDGGAHWYRSSAVLLAHHRWFNAHMPEVPDTMLPCLEGCTVRADCGIRLVELRSQPEGVVFHHWEFLHHPPNTFLLRPAQIEQLAPDMKSIGLLVLDDQGNILKKKLYLSELDDSSLSGHQDDKKCSQNDILAKMD